MDERRCPIDGCEYLIPEGAMANPALAAIHLSGHLMNHKGQEKDRSKVEAVKRPTISAAGTTQDWLYFMSRWGDYVQATKVQGAEKAIQLLECCDPGLRRDLQRNNGVWFCRGCQLMPLWLPLRCWQLGLKTQQWQETACTVCHRTEKRM